MSVYHYDSVFLIKDANMSAFLSWDTPLMNFTETSQFDLTVMNGKCHIVCLSNCTTCSLGNVMFNFTFSNISALGKLYYSYTTNAAGSTQDGIYPVIDCMWRCQEGRKKKTKKKRQKKKGGGIERRTRGERKKKKSGGGDAKPK